MHNQFCSAEFVQSLTFPTPRTKECKFVKSSEWVNVTNWGLSHKGLGIRSEAKVAVLYLCMRAFQLLQRERGQRQIQPGRERVLGSPWSLGKGRQAALSSGEDSIINDASTRSHLGIPYSLGDLLHLILSRVWCGLPLKWYASHTHCVSCIMNDGKETLMS